MAEISVPSNVTFDTLNQIVVGWYRAKAHESPIGNPEVSKRLGIDVTNVSRQNVFLTELGILQKDGNQFRLASQGTEYAKSLDFGQLEDAKRVLRRLVRDWAKFGQVLDYLDLKGPLQKDELAKRIGLAADKQVTGGTKTGIYALIDMLLFSDIVASQDSMLGLNKDLLKGEGETPAQGTQTAPVAPSSVTLRTPSLFAEFPVRIELTLALDNSTDPEKLRLFLKAIRDVFTEREQ